MLCLFIIIYDKTCHTVPMMLVANSCLSAILFGTIIFSIRLYTLKNDWKTIVYKDSFCSFRGYIGYAACSIQNFSYLLQSIYRYIIVIYPNRLFFQSIRFQLFLISCTWIFGFIYPIAFLFTDQIIYNINNQICQLPLQLSFSVIFIASWAYIIPVSLTMFIYFNLLRYVKEISKRVISVNRLSRVKRELKMVRRIVVLVMILFTLCFPYTMFIFLSFFTDPPKYHFRIAYIFIDVSFLFVIIALFQSTDPLKKSVMNKINKRPNRILPTVA
ncbi:unnamed protein product [Rotaria sordida]|uniref:G-protein coupled receptors family 1 profile domain-containing protein n=1 Tax=Rotaria sordida TaxID=392033 RepID=A0A819GIT8_9BILA|nr:unnamed protein product [Rotaria sordida]CAF1197201.1 unnamed protein product [Rotaria sordida]CAF1440192.1 unnamed protein product [Rotaria sordida]CAF3882575.1 unnamed protein product [Rotaria sordida]